MAARRSGRNQRSPSVIVTYITSADTEARLSQAIDILLRGATNPTPQKPLLNTNEKQPHRETHGRRHNAARRS